MAKKVKKTKKSTRGSKPAKPAPRSIVEYLVIPVNVTETAEELTKQLNIYGTQGWNLVWCTGSPGMGFTQAWFMR